MERSLSDDFNFEKELLYTPGRGRNTWSVYFYGETEDRVTIGYIFHLNITSIPLGFRSLKMYDSVLTISAGKDRYLFGRDFGNIQNDKELSKSELTLKYGCSNLFEESNKLKMSAYIPHVCVNATIDHTGSKKSMVKLKKNDQSKCEIVEISMAQTYGKCNVEFDGVISEAHGIMWAEKKYEQFPRGRVKKSVVRKVRVNIVPDGSDSRFTLTAEDATAEGIQVYENKGGKLCAIHKLGSDSLRLEKNWTSPNTGNEYPSTFSIVDMELGINIRITPNMLDQEVYSPYKKKREGEYMGIGSFQGILQGTNVKGFCSIEISE